MKHHQTRYPKSKFPAIQFLAILAAAVFGSLLCTTGVDAKPLKVYILAGQSNMEGHARVSTFPYVGKDPKTAPLFKEMIGADGKPSVSKDVYISYLSNSGRWGGTMDPFEKNGPLTVGFGNQANGPKIGPEFTFGIYMHKNLNEPVLLIKTAWGGKSLHTDFRPPSAGPYPWNKAHLEKLKRQKKDLATIKKEKINDTGLCYQLMIEHVKKVLADPKKYHPAYNEKDGYEIAGFVWFQGFNDLCDGNAYPQLPPGQNGRFKDYTDTLCKLIRDLRKDFNAPKMRVVIGVLGVNGTVKNLQKLKKPHGIEFRKAMAAPAALPEFKGNVFAVRTGVYWDKEMGEIDIRWRQKVGGKRAALKKNKSLSKEEREKALEKYTNIHFNARERDLMNNARSNAGYHYFGSAKTFAQFGKAFAEAMLEK